MGIYLYIYIYIDRVGRFYPPRMEMEQQVQHKMQAGVTKGYIGPKEL